MFCGFSPLIDQTSQDPVVGLSNAFVLLGRDSSPSRLLQLQKLWSLGISISPLVSSMGTAIEGVSRDGAGYVGNEEINNVILVPKIR